MGLFLFEGFLPTTLPTSKTLPRFGFRWMGNFPATHGKICIDIKGRQVLGTFNGWKIPMAEKAVSSLSEPINALMGDCLVLRVGVNNH